MPHTPTDLPATPGAEAERDVFGTVALGAAAISLLGFAVLVVGHLLDPSDFNNGPHPIAANNVAFFAYVLGLLIALLLGGAVWFYGRRSGRTGPRSAAAFATYYGIAFLLIGLGASARGG